MPACARAKCQVPMQEPGACVRRVQISSKMVWAITRAISELRTLRYKVINLCLANFELGFCEDQPGLGLILAHLGLVVFFEPLEPLED